MALKRERHAVERVRVWRERLASSEGHGAWSDRSEMLVDFREVSQSCANFQRNHVVSPCA
jgi:hypothetical protein